MCRTQAEILNPSAIGFSSWIVSRRWVAVNTQRSTDESPLYLNSFIADSIVALENAMPTSASHCEGFSLSFDAITDAKYMFSSLKKWRLESALDACYGNAATAWQPHVCQTLGVAAVPM
jgi:hypothetical protein